MKLTFSKFLKDQWSKLPPVVPEDLTGKTIIVTGANNGLGFEAAKHFARMKPGKLILACRSKQKGEQALSDIVKATGCQTVELKLVDLAEFESVKSFVKNFEQENDRLDILLENAGLLPDPKASFTKDGWDPSVQVNDLSQSLLALLLLPRLLETARKYNVTPRLVSVTSEMHFWSKFDKKLLDSSDTLRRYAHKDYIKSTFDDGKYGETKLLNVFFARALNDRLPPNSSLIVNCVNPGFCYSGFRKSFTGFKRIIDWLMDVTLARTTEEGSRVLVWASLGGSENLNKLKGAYVSSCRVEEPSDFVISAEGLKAQNKLWTELVKELTLVDPMVGKNVADYLHEVDGYDRTK
ncbi:short-chain dehydrogenase [Agrocybe pediades]|nr:short-chain dehydrogenase [Agrocybe pediades]